MTSKVSIKLIFFNTGQQHHRGPHLDYSHTVSSEEGTPASLLPQATEEIWSEKNPDSSTVTLWRAS